MKLHNVEIRVITERDIDDVYQESRLAKGVLWAVCLSAVLWFGGAVAWWVWAGAKIP